MRMPWSPQREGKMVGIPITSAVAYDGLSCEVATPERWARTYQVTVVSQVRMIRALALGVRRRGWGRRSGSGDGR